MREDSPVGRELDGPWFKTRLVVVCSDDGGRHWDYLSTISSDQSHSEGVNENDLCQLPDGRLFAIMRTGIHGQRDQHGREQHDQPLLVCFSNTEGQDWSEPERIYADGRLVTGIYPRALVTDDGVLAVMRTRLDGSVILCPDGKGAVWTEEVIFESPHTQMDDMALVGPNTLGVMYMPQSQVADAEASRPRKQGRGTVLLEIEVRRAPPA